MRKSITPRTLLTMRAGVFELAIVDSNRVPLPEVSAPGRSYAVAQPGQEFQVLFQFSVMVPNTVYKVELSLDGRDVGYTKIYKSKRAGTPAYFDGFLEERGSDGMPKYRCFQFATPQQDASKVVNSMNSFAEGKLVCKVWEARLRGVGGFCSQKRTVPDATVAALPEGKKFFMGPSLTTAAGATKKGARFLREKYDRVGQGPVARLELHYETAATLLLRGLLKPDANREHRHILDACTGGGQQQQRRQEGAAAGPSKRSGDKRRIKLELHPAEQQHGQQQQQGQGQQQQQQAGGVEPEEIDLTGVVPWRPRPRDPLLAAKREGKELVCDLTGEAEEPRWRESKRQAIEID